MREVIKPRGRRDADAALALAGVGLCAASLAHAMVGATAAVSTAAAFGLYIALFVKPPDMCTGLGGCEAVLATPYARPLGVPLQYLGAVWLAAAIPLTLAPRLSWAWALLGASAVAFLAAVELRLKAFCNYCTSLHIIILYISIILLFKI